MFRRKWTPFSIRSRFMQWDIWINDACRNNKTASHLWKSHQDQDWKLYALSSAIWCPHFCRTPSVIHSRLAGQSGQCHKSSEEWKYWIRNGATTRLRPFALSSRLHILPIILQWPRALQFWRQWCLFPLGSLITLVWSHLTWSLVCIVTITCGKRIYLCIIASPEKS